MKKTLLIFLIAISYFSAFSQTIEIDDYTWYIHSYEVNGNITDKPFSPEMTIQLDFDLGNNVLMSDLCCGGNFQLDINVYANNSTFQGSNFTNTAANCTETANTSFADLVHNFFENNVNDDFTYNITEENFLTVELEVSTPSGEVLRLYNTPHLDKTSIILDQYLGFEWRVNYIEINDTFHSFDYPNEEFDEITATFYHNGTFQTDVCDQLNSNFTLGESSASQKIFLNCNNINFGTSDCANTQNTTLQNLYFSFFINNANEILDLEFIPIDGQTGPCTAEDFMITAPSGDYIVYTNCSLLNLNENELNVITFYPNPAKQTVFIEKNHQQVTKIKIIDISGKQLKIFKNVKNQVDVSELPSGVYFFKIYSEGNTTIKKVIKE